MGKVRSACASVTGRKSPKPYHGRLAREVVATLRSETKLAGAGTCEIAMRRISQGAVARSFWVAGPVSSRPKGERQERPDRRDRERAHALEPGAELAERVGVDLLGGIDVERRRRVGGEFDGLAHPPDQAGHLGQSALGGCDGDGPVAQREHPARVRGHGEGDERFARRQLAQHIGGGGDLLHELAVVGRRLLQGRLCIGKSRLCRRELLGQLVPAELLVAGGLALLLGRGIEAPLQIGDREARILLAADCGTDTRVLGGLRQAGGREGDLLDGDAALPQLGGGEHLSEQRLALRRLAVGLGSERREARLQQGGEVPAFRSRSSAAARRQRSRASAAEPACSSWAARSSSVCASGRVPGCDAAKSWEARRMPP